MKFRFIFNVMFGCEDEFEKEKRIYLIGNE